MEHHALTEELREHIVLYAFHMLDEDAAADFLRHVEACTVCRYELAEVQSTVDVLGYSAATALPPPGLKARLLARLAERATAGTPPVLKRTAHDFAALDWEPSAFPGVSFHWLRQDATTGTGTALVKIQPGCSYGAHRHRGGEDCLVLQGGFRDRLGEYYAGDFVYYAVGSVHHDLQALEGEDCILFVVAHGGLELLPAATYP
jgi:anti-sigma factor ChrR (cupin superfamily)